MRVSHAATLADARVQLGKQAVDLAIVQTQLADGSGFDLAALIDKDHRTTATLMIAADPDLAQAQQALRSGAADLISTTVSDDELVRCLDAALRRRRREAHLDERIQRLHRLCRKLNTSRNEVSQQVDVLCNDLVIAYQELAQQMQGLVQSDEFGTLTRDELDLESLLRKTLEHLMSKLGPANAAIFLPATLDEYSLGGYVNYDCTSATADLLLEQLGDELAPRIADTEDLIHLTDPTEVESWVGPHAHMLEHAGLAAVPCMSGDECLAVLVLFRDLDQPFEHEHLDRVSALAPMLGDALEKIIRVHHRSVFNADAPDGCSDEDMLPF